MRRIVVLVALAAASNATAFAQTPVVIPPGKTIEFEFPRPNHALPPGGEWVGGTGNPQGYEHDPITPDDPMGEATGVDPATIGVENKGGVLSGPNGAPQNGFGEGAVIEVKICWTYRYPITNTNSKVTKTRPFGMGGS
jgi:hypothetical protein